MAQLDDEAEQSKPKLSAPVPISSDHDTSKFDCGVKELNDWLRERARKNEATYSRTFVVCDGDRVVAYYCLAAGSVEREDTPNPVRKDAPKSIPVLIIGRLAVDLEYAGKGLGADLLADALLRALKVAEIIGIAAVLIHAKSEAARRFYLRCAEFIEYPDDSRTLFLPIGTIVAALS